MAGPQRLMALLATLVGLVAIGLVPAAVQPAAAVPDGSITGTVTSPGKGPLQGVIVEVSLTVTTGTIGEVTTAADGSYTLAGIVPGDYYVEFDTSGATITPAGLGYETQWSPGVEDSGSAEPVGVVSGTPTTVNGSLVQYGEIKGKITEAENGKPAAGADVQAFNSSHSLALSEPAITAADGTYTLLEAVPGVQMVVQIEDTNDQRFSPQYVGGKYVSSEGKRVSATSGAVTSGINQAIVGRGTVEGAVTDKNSHAGLGSATVSMLDSAGNLVATRFSSSGGAYSVNSPAGVPMRFEFTAGGSYVTQYYNDRPSLSCADPVTVAANVTKAGISAAMTTSTSQLRKCTSGGGGKGPTTAQIKSSLAKQLVPTGKGASRPKIHDAGGYTYHFSALEHGTLVITWKSTSGKKLGSAKISFTGKSTHTVKVSLNSAGEAAFGAHHHPHLVITGSFTPNGGKAVTASKKFTPSP